LKSISDWKKFCKGELPNVCKKAENIYSYPEIAYQNRGWNGWERILLSMIEKASPRGKKSPQKNQIHFTYSFTR